MTNCNPFHFLASSPGEMPVTRKREKATENRRNPVKPAIPSGGRAVGQPSSPPDSAVSAAEDASDVAGPSVTVLFVSDDDYFRATMRAYLEDEGLLVRSCGDIARIPALFFDSGRGTSGASACQSTCVDLLLIDVHSLGATGIRLAAELTSFSPDLPVIVISTPEAAKSQWAALARRSWNFLYKPVLLPELLELVHSVLAPRQQPARKSNRLSPASPAADNSPRSRSGRSAGTDCDESRPAFELPLRLLKTPGGIQ